MLGAFRKGLQSAMPALIGLALISPVARAQEMVTGAPAASNCRPFGCGDAIVAWEQMYSAQAFDGPIAINSVEFFQAAVAPSGGTSKLVPGTFAFYFTTTTKTLDDFAANSFHGGSAPGGDMSLNWTSPLVLFATVTVGSNTPGGDFVVTSGSPYLYDPNAGNLLLHIAVSTIGTNTGSETFFEQSFFDPANSPLAASAYSQDGFLIERSLALDTRFDGEVVGTPEPATLALVTTGLIGVGGWARRRRRSQT